MEEESDTIETISEKTSAISICGSNGKQTVIKRSISSVTKDQKTVGIFKFEQHIDNRNIYQDFNDDEIDDEVFIDSETSENMEEFPNLVRPRERRVSDVIDCLGTPPSPSSFSKRHSFADFPPSSPFGRNVPIVMKPSKSDFSLKANFNVKSNSSPPTQNNFMDRNFCSPPSTPYSDGGYGSIGLPTPPSVLINKTNHFRYSTTSVEMVTRNDQVDAKPIIQPEPPNLDPNIAVKALMPVDADAEEYNMDHPRRGRAIIFNHDKFEEANMPDRIGSEIDRDNLEKVFGNLGFQVTCYENLKWGEMKFILDELSQENHSDADCLAIIVLTHGIDSSYLISRDVAYKVDQLWLPFTAEKCITLAGKPKLFFIQACRGDKLDKGLKLVRRTQTDSGQAGYKIPTCADFLLAFSTFEGYYSWRHPENGTWFIQSLCEELFKNGSTMDLLKLLTRVSRKVAVHHQSFNDYQPWLDEQKQVPSINSMLIRDVYFRPKKK